MAVNTTTWESTLQTKLNDTTLTSKDMLLVGKTLEATTGNIAVSDVNTAGATQVSEINAVATNTFKTVGGTSVLGSGDIATLPSQSGASGKVLKSDGTTATWGTGSKILQVVNYLTHSQSSGATNNSSTDVVVGGISKDITPVGTNSKFLVEIRWFGEMASAHDVVMNVQMDGTRVNVNGNTGGRHGIGLPALTYYSVNNESTPESATFSTLVTSTSVIGTAITFRLVVSSTNPYTFWTNRTFNLGGQETGSSEIIITEIGA